MYKSSTNQALLLKSMLQISSGNIPSQMAHSVQIVKMAQAFANKVESFELVTSGDVWSIVTRKQFSLQDWYGLHSNFPIRKIPLHLKKDYPFPKDYYGGKKFYILAALYSLIKSPTLVYTRTPAIVKLLLRMNIPVMWELHEIVKEEVFHEKILTNNKLVGFVTISPKIADIAISKGLPSEKIIIETSAVDLQKFLPYKSKELARQEISLPQNVSTVVYTGHLYDYKGIPTILEAAKLMPECRFLLVGGWQNDVDRIREICSHRQLNNVFLTGHVPQSQLAVYLYAADVLILPTSKQWRLSEVTSPLKLFDYMASQRPIVASALPNIETVVQDGHNVLLAEPDNSLSFKAAIEQLLKETTLSKSIAEQAFQDVQKYTWEKRAERILKFAQIRLSAMSKS